MFYKKVATKNWFAQHYLFGQKDSAGFTLLELLVVITIATILTTALVIQNSKWNDRLAVKSQAYEIVLMLRQAQFYSLAVREDKNGTGDKFGIGYGVYLSSTGSEKAVIFVDRDGDGEYDSPTEKVEEKNLTRGVTVDKVCQQIQSPCPGNGPKKVNVTFKRPTSNASFVFKTANGTTSYVGPAFVNLVSSQGYIVTITIDPTGQISISK